MMVREMVCRDDRTMSVITVYHISIRCNCMVIDHHALASYFNSQPQPQPRGLLFWHGGLLALRIETTKDLEYSQFSVVRFPQPHTHPTSFKPLQQSFSDFRT
jgi:hypothetical protein